MRDILVKVGWEEVYSLPGLFITAAGLSCKETIDAATDNKSIRTSHFMAQRHLVGRGDIISELLLTCQVKRAPVGSLAAILEEVLVG